MLRAPSVYEDFSKMASGNLAGVLSVEVCAGTLGLTSV